MCTGFEITLEPWRGGQLIIELMNFEQLKEVASQSGWKADLGKHALDDCLCQVPEDIVHGVIGKFVLAKALEGFAVTVTTAS